ncbi:MAG: preprotein translocase subunit SecE [Armatimonadetes bacterium]|nr:preprotein translocase subunit SecE [Armatimonadota bacterium]
MQRVVWPSKEETYTYTLVVVVAVVVVAAWVGFWDTVFTQIIAGLRLYQ